MPESFGQRLGRLRALHGWTQQALADRLARSRVAIVCAASAPTRSARATSA